MIRRLGNAFAAFFRATTPDPFVLAIILTGVVFFLAVFVEGASLESALDAWRGDTGFFGLLSFTMQMVLMLVTGHALASAPPVKRALVRVAAWPKSGGAAAGTVALIAMGTSVFNWGLGLIVGAVIARDVGRSCYERGVRAHYPLLCAAGYTGLICWHGGLSGSAPLKMTRAKDVTELLGKEMAARVGEIPLTRTIFSTSNLVITLGLLVLVPAVCWLLSPKEDEPMEEIDRFQPEEPVESVDEPPRTLPEKIESSVVLVACIGFPMAIATVLAVRAQGVARLDLNTLNLAFFTIGLFLHGSLKRYTRAVGAGMGDATALILQFPFYGGIMGVIRGTGLSRTLAGWMSSSVSATWFPAATFASAAVVNMFVPSGGGQWAVQGPIALETALRLHVAPEGAVMAVAYGDQITNMLQPFWALPLLAITGVKAKDIIGYTALMMLFGAVWVLTLITVWT